MLRAKSWVERVMCRKISLNPHCTEEDTEAQGACHLPKVRARTWQEQNLNFAETRGWNDLGGELGTGLGSGSRGTEVR